ncbi:MAG: DUF3857 domain-containing protein [Candidatus Azobacteroides sp.]|nr:DUF3857 domain-containing protein [Candidatus Azobacteroides sp.]
MKRRNNRIFLCFLLLFTGISFSTKANKGEYQKGWEAFSNNNRSDARKYFTAAIGKKEKKAEAFLSLALLDWSESKDKEAFLHFQKFYEVAENPYPYFYAVFSLPFLYNPKNLPDNQWEFYEKIVKDPDLHGTLKAMVCQQLGEQYLRTRNREKSLAFFSEMGAINNWQVLGAFDNISGSGFDKDWGAVAKPEQEAVFKNDVEADITWYTPSFNRPDNWFFFDYYFPLNSIIVYAQTFVNSPVAQEVYLRTGTSGSLKIWVNDVLVSIIPDERNCDLDIYSYKVNLNQGYNRILVQIGQSEISAANFLLRLTDERAFPVSGITSTADYQEYKKNTTFSGNGLLTLFAESFFQEKIKEEPDNLLYYILLGETYLRNDKAYEGTEVLKKAETMVPGCSFINYRLTEAYLRAQNRTEYSREIENIKQNDPLSFIALKSFYEDAMAQEKLTEAELMLYEIKEKYGESIYTDEMELALLSAHKKRTEVIELSEKLYEKYPYDPDYMSVKFSIEENVNADPQKAQIVLEEYNERYFNPQALEMLSSYYKSRGETEKALEVLKKRIQLMPYASGYVYDYISNLYQLQRYEEALVAIEDLKKLSPYMASLYNLEGYIYKDMNKEKQAKASFRKAVYYAPTSYDSRTQLRLLENKPEIFDLFPSAGLEKLIEKAPATEAYPEDNSLIVLYDTQLVFYPEGALEYRYTAAVKILNQSGIEEWKDYGINYNRNSQKLILDKYEVIKANGQKVKAETNNSGRVVFTNLEVGDILHLDYRIQCYGTGILSRHFYDWFLLKYSYPSLYSRVSILVPKNKEFDYKVLNADIRPVISEKEDMTLYQWILEGQPAIKDEPYMSSYVDVEPAIVFSSIPDWKFIGNWYKDLTTNKIKSESDYIVKRTIAEILNEKENLGQLEKAKLFYEYILQNITYSNVPFMQSNFIPQKASRTIITRLGDCKDVSTLFVTLCRATGIKANLVLISTREYGNNMLSLPSPNFNHCIAQLEIDGKIYYLELTDNHLPFGAAIDSDLQCNILPIPYREETSGRDLLLMDMPDRIPNKVTRETILSVKERDFLLSHHFVRKGQLASFYRYRYADIGAEERRKDVTQMIASDWNQPVKVSDLTFMNLDNLADSVVYGYTLEVTNALQEVAGMKIFKLPWSDALPSLALVALEKRTYPLEFWSYLYCDEEEEGMQIILSPEQQFVEIPKNVTLECPAASYELSFQMQEDGTLHAKRFFKKKKDIVLPEEYEEFKEFFNTVSENDNKQYAIK